MFTFFRVVMGLRPGKDPGPREPCTEQYNDPDVICIPPPRWRLGRCGLSFSLRYASSARVDTVAGHWQSRARAGPVTVTVLRESAGVTTESRVTAHGRGGRGGRGESDWHAAKTGP